MLSSHNLSLGQRIESIGGPSLTIARTSYAPGDYESGLPASLAVGTEDGRGFIAEWHSGDETDAVYFETYGLDGRESHGWIDSASRRIVQTG